MANRAVCVFCGSSRDVDPRYLALARDVGTRLADANLRVVYGGASIGMMGAVADAALARGGRVTGVIPARFDAREVMHTGLDDLRVVDTMHERKQLMVDESDAFLALPGGYGTLDELFEVTTWKQIGLHDKPIALYDPTGFYEPLRGWIANAVRERFVAPPFADAIAPLPDGAALDAWIAEVARG